MTLKDKFGPNVAVIGASTDRSRFSNKAVRAFQLEGYNVFPVNPNYGEIEGLKSYRKINDIPDDVDFASIYLNPRISMLEDLSGQLHEKNVKAAILNPGAEGQELISGLKKYGIETLLVCSIRSLGLDPSDL
jgi:uncharacterized protein